MTVCQNVDWQLVLSHGDRTTRSTVSEPPAKRPVQVRITTPQSAATLGLSIAIAEPEIAAPDIISDVLFKIKVMDKKRNRFSFRASRLAEWSSRFAANSSG